VRLGRLTLAAAAALALSPPALAASPQVAPLAANEVLLEVDGVGISRTRGDVVTIPIQVMTMKPTPAEAERAVRERVGKIVAAALAAEIPEADIRSAEPQGRIGFVGDETWPGNGGDSPGVFPATRSLSIRLADPSVLPRLRESVLAAAGLSIPDPVYSLADDTAAREAAKADAIRTGKANAESYARAAGMRLGRLLRISERRETPYGDPDQIEKLIAFTSGRPTEVPGEVETRITLQLDFALLPR
jgi:uncharacterized protein YggE